MTVKVRFIDGHDGSVDKSNGTSTLRFQAWDTDKSKYDTEDINAYMTFINSLYDAVRAASPLSFNGLSRKSISWTEESNRTRRFNFTVGYSWALPESERRWSFDTGGGTFKITASKATTRYARPGGIAPNFQGAIEVKDGRAEGVEITIPALKITCTYRHPVSSTVVNAATIDNYIKQLSGMTGKTNNAAWLTYEQGELLFLGASGEYVPNQPAEFQYQFAVSRNAASLTIGAITGIVKRGHDYVWVLYEPGEDATAKKLIQTPLAAYVERVYDETNFLDLGIGS
jgi:hypothetical protein